MKVIQFVEYIQFQVRRVTKQLINMHNVFLVTLSRITAWCIDVQRSVELSATVGSLRRQRNATCNSALLQSAVSKLYNL